MYVCMYGVYQSAVTVCLFEYFLKTLVTAVWTGSA